jgi:hypothetical protein
MGRCARGFLKYLRRIRPRLEKFQEAPNRRIHIAQKGYLR